MLGEGGIGKLAIEDWNVVQFLYYGIDLAKQVPPSTAKARGDVAAGSPASSTAVVYSENKALSMKEDDLSPDRTPLGEDTGAEPASKVAQRRRHGLRCLTRRVREMAIDADHVKIPEKGTGQTPWP